LKIIFTSSVALAITQSAFDLSRRINLLRLPLFSFREYIYFTTETLLPPLSLENIIQKNWSASHLRYGFLFEKYLCGGILPFSLEEPDPLPLLENILKKILQRDIPSIASIRVEEIALMEKMIRFIGKSTVDGINYSSISKNIGITKYKAAA
jgi:predicted AAA+ superfamily ATPase